MPVLAVRCPFDAVLSAVAPLGAAVAVDTALVVDLDPDGPRYPGEGSLARLVADGPRAEDLVPRRRGVAVLRNGGVDAEAATEVVEALAAGWPHLVLRLPGHASASGSVTVVPLVPVAVLSSPPPSPTVYQRGGWRVDPPGPGPVLPPPRRATLAALLAGRRPPLTDRWIRAWRRVWEAPWV